MTGLLILIFIPLLVVAAFLIRTRAEQRARLAAELRAAQLEDRVAHGQLDPEWAAVLAHELRSPVAAILGYGELLEDGTFGAVDERMADALHRIRLAASQLVTLIEAVEHMGTRERQKDLARDISARQLILDTFAALHFEAEGRGTRIVTNDTDLTLHTRPLDALRVLTLLLGSAIKASPGAELHVEAHPGPPPVIAIRGSRPVVADVEPRRLSGPALRIQLARLSLTALDGRITVHADGTIRLELPHLAD